jgi:N-acetylmuramoyl-L-alanine amidase
MKQVAVAMIFCIIVLAGCGDLAYEYLDIGSDAPAMQLPESVDLKEPTELELPSVDGTYHEYRRSAMRDSLFKQYTTAVAYDSSQAVVESSSTGSASSSAPAAYRPLELPSGAKLSFPVRVGVGLIRPYGWFDSSFSHFLGLSISPPPSGTSVPAPGLSWWFTMDLFNASIISAVNRVNELAVVATQVFPIYDGEVVAASEMAGVYQVVTSHVISDSSEGGINGALAREARQWADKSGRALSGSETSAFELFLKNAGGDKEGSACRVAQEEKRDSLISYYINAIKKAFPNLSDQRTMMMFADIMNAGDHITTSSALTGANSLIIGKVNEFDLAYKWLYNESWYANPPADYKDDVGGWLNIIRDSYDMLKDRGTIPMSDDLSGVRGFLRSKIEKHEGSYTSVNDNDNGRFSFGICGFRGTNARDVLEGMQSLLVGASGASSVKVYVLYAGLSALRVKKGDSITKDTIIGDLSEYDGGESPQLGFGAYFDRPGSTYRPDVFAVMPQTVGSYGSVETVEPITKLYGITSLSETHDKIGINIWLPENLKGTGLDSDNYTSYYSNQQGHAVDGVFVNDPRRPVNSDTSGGSTAEGAIGPVGAMETAEKIKELTAVREAEKAKEAEDAAATDGRLVPDRAGAASVGQAIGSAANGGSTTVSQRPLAGKIVVIDPGHQQNQNSDQEPVAPNSSVKKAKVTSGTAGVTTGTAEYIITLDVGLKLRDLLVSQGATVVMTRDRHDVDVSNVERAKIGNDANADLAVRLHADGSADSSVKGISMLVPSADYVGQALADTSAEAGSLVLSAVISRTGAKNRGVVKRDDMTGFNWSTVPCILIEMGFMSNADEDRLLNSPEYQDKLAHGLYDGIAAFLAGN